MSLENAKNVAIALTAIFGFGAVAAAWVMKTVMQRILVTAVLALFAFAVWTQRTSLQDCADKVKDAYELGATTIPDTDCSFFGTTITIRDPRTTE